MAMLNCVIIVYNYNINQILDIYIYLYIFKLNNVCYKLSSYNVLRQLLFLYPDMICNITPLDRNNSGNNSGNNS